MQNNKTKEINRKKLKVRKWRHLKIKDGTRQNIDGSTKIKTNTTDKIKF